MGKVLTSATAILLLLLSGCMAVPTQQEQGTQNYGEPVGKDDAQAKVVAAMSTTLKDPDSAKYDCSLGGKGWLGSGKAWGEGPEYGWLVGCKINAKNSYGAYVGAEQYAFVFRDGVLRRGSKMLGGDVTQVVYDNP